MKPFVLTMMALALASAGCSRQDSSTRSADGAPSSRFLPTPLADALAGDPREILISVNGHELTRAEALRQVNLRLGGPPPADMPPERINAIRNQVISKVVDEFVKRELLLHEAERVGIEAGEEEITVAINNIRGKTPAGQDPMGILRDGPAGGDSLRNEVITGIRIEKLLASALPPPVDPSEDEVQAFLAQHRDKLTLPERVEASHILVEVKPEDTDEVKTRKRAHAEALRQQILDGADFAELASQESGCPSARHGGNLGLFPRGKMAKSFEDAAFRQKEGDIGDVVESPFGFHIIRVERHLAPGLADTADITTILHQRARTLALADYIRTLEKTAEIKHSASIRPPAAPPP